MILLLKLILAHLAGDFLFQTAKSVKNKEEHKLSSPLLYLHILIHGLVLVLLFWDLNYWAGILFIIVTHFIIDTVKLYIQNNRNRKVLFFVDQSLHFLVLASVWMYYEHIDLSFMWMQNATFLLTIICVYFLTQPTSIILKVLISNWAPKIGDNSDESLENAGKYIGILERLFAFVFIITDNWEAIGFLIAAKSVFRFGDLKESKDRKLTEYILIGTLISFGIAILVGFIYSLLIINI